jgi:hypothetical protein
MTDHFSPDCSGCKKRFEEAQELIRNEDTDGLARFLLNPDDHKENHRIRKVFARSKLHYLWLLITETICHPLSDSTIFSHDHPRSTRHYSRS